MRNTCKGSITVFLSLMMTVILLVITVCLESAHQEAVGAELAMKSEEAGENLFSHFERKLYERYNIISLNDRLQTSDLLTTAMENPNTTEGSVFHLNYQLEQISMENTHYLGDENGKGFQLEVNEIMTEEVIKDLKKEISEYLKSGKESEDISQQLDMVTKEQGNLTSLVELFSEIEAGCNDLNRIAVVMYDYQTSYYEAAKAYEIGDMTFHSKTSGYRSQLEYNEGRLKHGVGELLTWIHEYKQLAVQISANMKQSKKDLKQESLSEENRNLLYEELKAISDMTESDGKSYQVIIKLEESLLDSQIALESSLYPKIEVLMDYLKVGQDIDGLFKPGMKIVEKLKEIKLSSEKSEFESKDVSSVKKLLKTVKKIIKSGPFAYIMGDTEKLSDRKVDMTKMPSITYEKNSSEDTEHLFRRLVEESAESFAMNLYLTEYMGCYTDGGNYDLEYILGGKDTDLKNLKVVINQLVLIRTSLNLVYLMKDEVKREQAELAATAIACGTGLPALEKVASFVILSAWAYAEAVLDVKSLVEGGKVTFFKSDANWKLDLDHASEVTEEITHVEKDKSGLTYKEYLRIMLFFHSRVRNLYRGLDMIQWNLCEIDSDFRISQCIYETGIKVKARAPYLFLGGSLEGHLIPDANLLCLSQKVGYCSIEWAT